MEDYLTVGQRLKLYLSQKKISVRSFEESCGFSNGWVNSIKEQIRLSAISQLVDNYPDINLNWLFTGSGPMLIPVEREETKDAGSVYPTNDVHHNQQVVIANWEDLRGVLEEVIKEQLGKV